MIKTIEMSYLILVDEEKHDGQNLQEEDEQEEDEELRRRNGKRKLSYFLTPFIGVRQKTTRGIMGIFL